MDNILPDPIDQNQNQDSIIDGDSFEERASALMQKQQKTFDAVEFLNKRANDFKGEGTFKPSGLRDLDLNKTGDTNGVSLEAALSQDTYDPYTLKQSTSTEPKDSFYTYYKDGQEIQTAPESNALTEWRIQTLNNINNAIDDIESTRQDLTDNERKIGIVRAHMDAALDLDVKDTNQLASVGPAAYKHLFKKDLPEGANFVDEYFEGLKGIKLRQEEEIDFNRLLASQAVAATFLNQSRFTNLNNKRILDHPHYKRIEDKSEMRRLFDGMRADASLKYDGVTQPVSQILDLVEKQVSGEGEIRTTELIKILDTVSADDLTKVAQAVAFVDYNMSEFYQTPERGIFLNLAEQGLRDYERFSDNQQGAFMRFFLNMAKSKLEEGQEITGIDTTETQEELEQGAASIDRLQRFASELRRYEQKHDPIKQIFDKDSVLGHLEKATYQIPGIGMSLVLATTPMTLGSMLYESVLDNYYQIAVDAGIDREEARLLIKPTAGTIAAAQSVLEVIGANAVLRGAPFLKKWVAKFDSSVARVFLGTTGSASVETATEEFQLITERMGQDFIAGIRKEFPEADWDSHWETFGWRQLEMLISVAPYSGLGALVKDGQISEAIALQNTASEDQLVALGFSRAKVEKFKNADTEKDQRVLFLEMVAEQNPTSDEAKEAVKILNEKREAQREALEQLSKASSVPGIRTAADNKTFQIYEPVTGETLFEFATEKETQQAFFELLGQKETGPAVDELVTLLKTAREATGESGLSTEIDLLQNVTEATVRSVLPNASKRTQEQIELFEEAETGGRIITKTVFEKEPEGKQILGAYLPAGLDGKSSPTIKLFEGSTAWTVIHEKAHHTRKLLIDNKALSREKQISFFKKLNSVIGDKTYTVEVTDADGNTAKEVRSLKFPGFDGDTVSDTALDEAFATFAEVAVLNSNKGKKTTLRDLLNQNLNALVRRNTSGAVQFRAFIRALKEWFGLNLRRAAVFKKATREGLLDRAEMEEFTAMVMGESIDEQHAKKAEQRNSKEAPSYQLGRIPKLNKNSANNLADKVGAPRFVPMKYEGRRILPIMADLLATGLYGEKDLQGGPAHPLLFYKEGSGVIWRSKKGAISGILGYLDRRGAVWIDENGIERALVAVFSMTQTSHKSNMDTFLAYIKLLQKAKISKKDKKILAEYVKGQAKQKSYQESTKPKKVQEGEYVEEVKDPKALEKFPEDWTLESLTEYGDSLSFNQRANFIKMMSLEKVAKTGLKVPRPNVVVTQLLDESYSKVPSGSMLSIMEVDVTRLREGVAKGTLKASDFGVSEHTSYDTVLPGKLVAHLREPIAMEVAFGDMVEKMAEVSPDSAPTYLLQAKIPAEVPLEVLTKNKIKRINDLQKKPVSVAKAKAYIAHYANKWVTLKKKSLQKGKNDYTRARKEYLYTELLDPNLAEDFTNLANKKGYEAYGLEGFDVWFTLAPTETGGKEIIEVVSNESVEDGFIDIVIDKAVANGATNVKTYTIPVSSSSKRTLPNIYRKHGFVEVSRKPYSKKELGSTAKERNAKEKELFALWESQGWDQALHGMPDLVALEYADTGQTIKNADAKSIAQEQIAEAGAKSTKPISRYDSYRGSEIDGRSFNGNFGGGRARDTREIYSFVSELEAATGDRLQAWGLTEAQRDTLLEEILDPDAGVAFSIGSQKIAKSLFDTALDRVTNPEAKAQMMFNIAARVETLKQDIDNLKESEIADVNRASRLASLKAELEELENYEPEISKFAQERLDKIEKEIEEQDGLLDEELEKITKAHKNRAFKIEVDVASRYESRIEKATGQKKTGLKREAKSVRSEKLKAENKRFSNEQKIAKEKAAKKQASLRGDKAKAEAEIKRQELKNNYSLKDEKSKIQKQIKNIESYDKVAQIRDSIEALDALTLSLPVELRGKIGGYAPLSKLNTEEKRLEYLFKKMDKVESVVEKYIRGKYLVQIKKLFKKAKQKTKEPRPKSTLDADILDKIKEVEALSKLTEKEKLDKLSALEEQLEKTKDPEQATLLEEEKLRISDYANVRGMGSLQLDSFYNNLKTLLETGKTLRDFYLEIQKLKTDEIIEIVNREITGGKGRLTAPEAEAREKKRNRVAIKLKAIGAAEDVTLGSLNKFHRKNISFEWLLNALTRESGTETLQSETNKNLAIMVHVATKEEKNNNLAANQKYTSFLSHIFGGIKGAKLANRIDKEFVVKVENSGVIKSDYRGKKAYDVKEITIEDFFAVLNNEKTIQDIGLTQVEFESAREYYDQKVERNVEAAIIDEEIAQEKENEAAEKENRKPNKIKRNPRKVSLKKVKYNSPNVGDVVNLTLSQGEAINLTMLYRQEGIKESMILEGYTEETMQQMEDFLTEESKKVRAWLTKEYDENYHIINDVYKRQNGANLPKIKNYSPARRLYQGEAKDLQIDSSGTIAMSTTPAFAITRTTNFAEVDRTANALDLYVSHIAQTNHYVSWAEPIRILRSIFANKDVKQNTIEYAGADLLNLINERIEWFADGGNRKARHIKMLDTLRTAHTFSSLSYNFTIGIKQLTSLPAYAFDMSTADFAKYSAKFSANPIKNIKTMLALPYVKTRFKEGFDRDVIEGLKKGGASYIVRGLQHGMIFGKLGDITPVIVGGWMARQRSYDRSIAEGLSEKEAWRKADIDFEMITDRAQQAGDLKDISSFQGGDSLARMFTMYATSPRQYYANVYETLLDASAGRKNAKKDFVRKAFIGHIILPLLFQFASDIMRHWGDDDELEMNDYLRAMLLGPLNGIFVIGDWLDMFFSAMAGTKVYTNRNPMSEAAEYTFRNWDKDWEFNKLADDMIKGIGKGVPSVPTFYSIIRREMKRFDDPR